MSKDYQFVATDTDAIVERMTKRFEEILGRTVQPASFEKLLIQWGADVVVQERVNINYAANQNIPSRAAGENLDALGEIFFASNRPQATVATTMMRFFISEAQPSALLIPAGTRVATRNKEVVFATVDDVYVPIGELYVDAKAVCDESGTVGNGYEIDQITELVDIFPYYKSCTNITMSDGGSDTATDEEFYEQLRLSEDAYSSAGASGSYEYFAKSVSTEIADVVVNSPMPGYINIFALMDDGAIASQEIKDKILAVCSADTVRPLTDTVSADDPNIISYDIDFTYYISRTVEAGASQIESAVQAAVDEYVKWQSARIGRDINPSMLISLLMKTGIKRVELASPVFQALHDGKDHMTPDVAKVDQISIVSGGYEDE